MLTIPTRVIERVFTRCHRDENGCLVSDYSVGSHGYAQIGWHDDNGHRHMTLCHRVAWIAAFGPIPVELTVDHRCRNRKCIEIADLRLLTNEDNGRGNGNSVKTHCLRGHEFTAENTWLDGHGYRRCRTCAREHRLARAA